MSKHETPMIMKYWKRVGGTLILELPVVKRTKETGPRRLAAVILPKIQKSKRAGETYCLKDRM